MAGNPDHPRSTRFQSDPIYLNRQHPCKDVKILRSPENHPFQTTWTSVPDERISVAEEIEFAELQPKTPLLSCRQSMCVAMKKFIFHYIFCIQPSSNDLDTNNGLKSNTLDEDDGNSSNGVIRTTLFTNNLRGFGPSISSELTAISEVDITLFEHTQMAGNRSITPSISEYVTMLDALGSNEIIPVEIHVECEKKQTCTDDELLGEACGGYDSIDEGYDNDETDTPNQYAANDDSDVNQTDASDAAIDERRPMIEFRAYDGANASAEHTLRKLVVPPKPTTSKPRGDSESGVDAKLFKHMDKQAALRATEDST